MAEYGKDVDVVSIDVELLENGKDDNYISSRLIKMSQWSRYHDSMIIYLTVAELLERDTLSTEVGKASEVFILFKLDIDADGAVNYKLVITTRR